MDQPVKVSGQWGIPNWEVCVLEHIPNKIPYSAFHIDHIGMPLNSTAALIRLSINMTNDYRDPARIDKTATTFLIRHLRGDPNSPRTIPTNNIQLPRPGCGVLQIFAAKGHAAFCSVTCPHGPAWKGWYLYGIKRCFAFSRTFLLPPHQLQYCPFAPR